MATRMVALMLPLMMLVMSQTASAEIYKWLDQNGEVQYSQQKPDNYDASPMNIVAQPLISGSDTGDASSAGTEGLAQQCATQESVEQYGTIYCCTASCVTQKRAKRLQFTCATQKCYEALIESDAVKRKAKDEEERKAKVQQEEAKARREAYENSARLKQEQADREIAIHKRARERRGLQ